MRAIPKLGSHNCAQLTTCSVFTSPMAVVFVDICNFTQLLKYYDSKGLESWAIFYHLFDCFDVLAADYHALRIKTNGDQYIAIIKQNALSPTNCAHLAFNFANSLRDISPFKLRIGVGFGSVTYGQFFSLHEQIDIWGETVIRAARLQQKACADQIIVDENIFDLLQATPDILFFKRRKLLKGMGLVKIYVNTVIKAQKGWFNPLKFISHYV